MRLERWTDAVSSYGSEPCVFRVMTILKKCEGWIVYSMKEEY